MGRRLDQHMAHPWGVVGEALVGHRLGRMGQPLVVVRILARMGRPLVVGPWGHRMGRPLGAHMGPLVGPLVGPLGGVVERMGQQLGRMALQGHKEAHNHRLEVVAAAAVVQRDQIQIPPLQGLQLGLGWAELGLGALALGSAVEGLGLEVLVQVGLVVACLAWRLGARLPLA